MRMYVGNASIQRHEFSYRLPGIDKSRTVSIPPMSQYLLPDTDMDRTQIDAIIGQHEKYGFASIDEVKSRSVKRMFTRLCYSIDRAISSLMIQALFDNNQTVLDESGKLLRQQMAIVANESVIKQLETQKQHGEAAPDATVENFEVTVQEEEPKGGYDRPLKEVIAEGIIVEPRHKTAKTSKRRPK